MEVLVSQTDMTVTTTLGHSVRFRANVPRPVPPVVVASALQAGARPAKDTPAPAEEEKGPTPREVAAAMRSIIEEADPDKLTQGGKVRIDALEQALGTSVTTACRREATNLIDSGEV